MNYSKAYELYQKSADQGYEEAYFAVGICYANGWGVTKNDYKSVEWYKKAAEQGVEDAQVNLGFCYYNGLGIQKNINEARRWWEAAAAQGNETAQENLEMLNSSGENGGGNRGILNKAIDFAQSDTGKNILGVLGTIGGAFAQGYMQASRSSQYYDNYDDDDEY